jgi:hypothetical protein
MENHGKGAENQDGRGNTRRVQGETQEPQPRQHDERDESADSQAPGEASQQRLGEIARRDAESNRVDTDKGPAMHEAYDKTRAGTPDPDKKFSP